MLTPMLVMAFICAAVVLFVASVRRVPEGQAYTYRRMDGHIRTLGSGMHFVMPLIERVAHKIRLLGNVVDVDVAGQDTTLRGQVYYQVLDASRADTIIDEVGVLVRNQLPTLLADAAHENASERNLQLKAELNRSLRERGVLITRVQLA